MIPALLSLKNGLENANSIVLKQPHPQIDFTATIQSLKAKVNEKARSGEPLDRVVEAVAHYWQKPLVRDLQDARYISFGLGTKLPNEQQSLLSHSPRFRSFFAEQSGIGQWKEKPNWFRRVLQGLIVSYFGFDPDASSTTEAERENWLFLRDYIARNLEFAKGSTNPDWLECCLEHKSLFTDSPGDDFVDLVLDGRSEELEAKLELIRAKESWLPRQLILSQIRRATEFNDAKFYSMVDPFLSAITPHRTIQDSALALLVNRFATYSNPIVHQDLKQAVVSRWDNPWLPGSEKKWPSAVTAEGKELIADWLKSEFIEAFFTKLAEDGGTDRRRLEFWMRYRQQMSHVQFALGNIIHESRDPDLMALKWKMKGLISSIKSARVNAFIMIIGDVIAVEFSATGNALYLYDASRGMPFNLGDGLTLAVDGHNSLKKSHGEKYSHHDGSNGFYRWEDMVADGLTRKFGLQSDAQIKSNGKGATTNTPTAKKPQDEGLVIPVFNPSQVTVAKTLNVISGITSWSDIHAQPYSEELLRSTCEAFSFSLIDHRPDGGALWVMVGNSHSDRNAVFRKWGFTYKPNKGWWKN